MENEVTRVEASHTLGRSGAFVKIELSIDSIAGKTEEFSVVLLSISSLEITLNKNVTD